MKTKRFLLFLILLPAICRIAIAEETKKDHIIVYGKNFSFRVMENKIFKGDTENASRFGANIIFYKSQDDIDNGGALIQILLFKKQDENTIDDLKYDISKYKKKYKNLKLKDFFVKHNKYECFSKLVFVEKKFYQYIVYINPGKKYRSAFSAAMNISKVPATEKELKAFEEIIRSLLMITEN